MPQEGGLEMADPVVAAKSPVVKKLQPGTYYWCSCGQSSDQPFCDGSHEGTTFEPLEFTVESESSVALCACKHTKNKPRCDGSHGKL